MCECAQMCICVRVRACKSMCVCVRADAYMCECESMCMFVCERGRQKRECVCAP